MMPAMSARPTSKKKWRSFSLKTLLVVISASAIFFAWRVHVYEHGTINDWIKAILDEAQANPLDEGANSGYQIAITPCPLEISDSEKLRLVMKATEWLGTPEHRTCMLKILAEQFPKEAHQQFAKIIKESKHDHLRRDAILLSSLFRIESDIETFATFLEHENPIIVAAAIDALGIVFEPTYPIPAGIDNFINAIVFKSKPRIDLRSIANELVPPPTPDNINRLYNQFQWEYKHIRYQGPPVYGRIKELMVADPNTIVREAAARFLLIREPVNYKLRVAEWGVWINEGESLTLAQSVIDEIPPFVHQTANRMASIKEGRTNSLLIITKPIIHIEVDQPMVLDVSVYIADGRPWFGYPMPDDFAVRGVTRLFGLPDPKDLPPDVPDNFALDELDDVREGYPWIAPSHVKQPISTITDVGFRWQSLIVLPQKADWMELENVSDPKYQWWNRLREVQTSWVSNRGESERFLYYDGPTNHTSPVRSVLKENMLEIKVPENYFYRPPAIRNLMFVEVKNGVVAARDEVKGFADSHRQGIILEVGELPYDAEAAAERMTCILVEQGLNRPEAEGLVACWRPQFFETEGKRLLTVFGKAEYDRLCPISISPQPTELARVGIVVTEFGESQSGKPD